MSRELLIRCAWVITSAVIGYSLAAVTFALPLETAVPIIWIVRILVPMINVTMLAPVDPDWSVALFLWGPVNAVLYGLIGLILGQKYIERNEG